MSKQKCKFSPKLERDFYFLKKGKVDHNVKFTKCNIEFSIAYGGRRDVLQHTNSKKHKSIVNASNISNMVTSFFKKIEPTNQDLACAAKEAVFSYHTARHDFSFNSTTCTSKLINNLYDPKFCSAKTKSEAIIVNIIAPDIFESVIQKLQQVNFITVIIDASNRLDKKLVPILVRFFYKNEIETKLLEFQELPGETSVILSEYIFKALEKYKLTEKVICFCADNTNTNFGGVKRKGTENVFTKLQSKMDRPLIGIGCAAHIVHNCVHSAVNKLPALDIECVIVKIFKYFHIFTVRSEKLKEFCEFAEVEYKKVLSHSSTRFLSLLPAIHRVLQIFDGLKSYFLSEDNCPYILRTFFEDKGKEFYLAFIHGTLEVFNKTILKMEAQQPTAIEICSWYNDLIRSIEERKHQRFVPFLAQRILNKESESGGQVDSKKLLLIIDSFYENCLKYLNLWKYNFEEINSFDWVLLKENVILEWTSISNTAEIINKQLKTYKINTDELFDEVTQLMTLLQKVKINYVKQIFLQKNGSLFYLHQMTTLSLPFYCCLLVYKYHVH